MNKPIAFSNGLTLELQFDGDRFVGIGTVDYLGTALRSTAFPWNVYTETEKEDQAFRFETFHLHEVRQVGDRAELIIHSRGLAMPRVQAADAMGESRIKNRRLKAPVAEFIWSFEAIREAVFENEWVGLSMQISYNCPGYPIHWLLEQATWELGAEAEGNTLIQQDLSAMDLEKVVKAEDSFSTIEKFFTDGWGGSFPMDMLPRAAGAAICDFQAKGDLALCLFSEAPGLTRARLDKFSDENVVHYLDRAYLPLGDQVQVQARKLLVYRAPRPLQRHDIRNLWLDCFMDVRRRIHATYDFELELPLPHVGAHLWDKDLKERMDAWYVPLQNDIAEYARMGFKQLFTHGVWESVTSDAREWVQGNICCPYAFKFADTFGGNSGMTSLSQTAVDHGIRVMQWFSFHLSQEAPVWEAHPDWVLKEANGDPWDGNYGCLWSGRIRSGYGEWFHQQILDVQQQTGIDGIFWDSYQNLGVTCVDWGAEDRAPQAEEIFRMQGELQRKGFMQRVEVITIFGVSQVALFGFKDDAFRRRSWDDFVSGDHAFTLLDCSPAFFSNETITHPDRVSPEKYFWMVAHRSVPGLGADPWEVSVDTGSRFPGGDASAAYARVNHLYNAALPYMDRPRLQPAGDSVLWLDGAGRPAVLWVIQDCSLDFDALGGTVIDFEDGSIHSEAGLYQLQSNHVYGLQPEVDWVHLLDTYFVTA